MNPDETKDLFLQVNQLHDANVINAEKTAENAVRIGMLLHQIKESVGHGNFLPAMAQHAKHISDKCCNNYMRLARERLIEEKARLLIPEHVKSATVADLPPEGNSVLPPNAIPVKAYDLARKEVEDASFSWLKVPLKQQQSLFKNIRGKDLMDLYRDYGVVRAKELKVYNPPKPQTPDEKTEADRKQAEAWLGDAENALQVILMDLDGKTSLLSTLVSVTRIKEFLRKTVTVNKRLRPLTKRKLSSEEKKSLSNAQVIKRRWAAAKRMADEKLRKAKAVTK